MADVKNIDEVLIIGGGASGMMAAIIAARNGKKVAIIEKNEKLGKKLFITGKGRCNYTNACDIQTLIESCVANPKFMYGSFRGFDSEAVISFFEGLGLKGKVERGNRVFPVSDKSSDVIKVLENEIKRLGVRVMLNTNVTELIYDQSNIVTEDESKQKSNKSASKGHGRVCKGVVTKNAKEYRADAIVIATGGLSYKSTGSSGDGFTFAKKAGIDVIKPRPGLAPLTVRESWVTQMQGLSLKNVEVTVFDDSESKRKVYYQGFGEMLFTHFGISGPLILSAESVVVERLEKGELKLSIDMKPALDEKKLDLRILREFENAHETSFKNVLRKLLPAKAVPVFIELSGINADKKSGDITKKERRILLKLLKELTMTVNGTRGFSEAIITRGGVNVNEINPKTMESKKIRNLYFIGEVLDVDAITGGFNLQLAWSSAYSCGSHI